MSHPKTIVVQTEGINWKYHISISIIFTTFFICLCIGIKLSMFFVKENTSPDSNLKQSTNIGDDLSSYSDK